MAQRITLILAALLLLLTGSVILYAIALQQWDTQLTQRAVHDIHLVQQQQSPFHWDFHQAHDIAGDNNDLGSLTFGEEGLKTTTTGRDTYFTLNLKERLIDQRYSRLQIRFYASQATRLQLFHGTPEHPNYTFASGFQQTRAGWQTLTIDLSLKSWHALKLPGWQASDALPLAKWGSNSGIINRLRLDLGEDSDIDFIIEKLSLTAPQPWPLSHTGDTELVLERVTPGQFPDRAPDENTVFVIDFSKTSLETLAPWLLKYRHTPTFLSDSRPIRTPEFQFRLQQQIQRLSPAAVLFPTTPSEILLKNINHDLREKEVKQVLEWPLDSWRYGIYLLAGLCTLLAVFLFFTNTTLKQSAPLELSLIISLVICIWWMGNHDPIWIAGLGIPGLALLCHLSTQRQAIPLRERLGFTWPDKQLYFWLIIIALPFFVLILSSSAHSTAEPIDSKRLATTMLLYPIWALVQQLVLGPVLANMFDEILQEEENTRHLLAAICSGFVFALLHYPNMTLMLATFFLATAWAWLFLRYRSIIPIAIAHGFIGAFFRELSSGIIRLDGDVGPAFFAWLYL